MEKKSNEATKQKNPAAWAAAGRKNRSGEMTSYAIREGEHPSILALQG
jgi:hypothetical protein